jgi:Tfp pilus assembly protein PilO
MKKGFLLKIIRWEILPFLITIISVTVFIIILVPFFFSIKGEYSRFLLKYTMIDRQNEINTEFKNRKLEISELDSLLNTLQRESNEGRQDIVSQVYTCSDSAHLSASKVQVSDKIIMDKYSETPVSVSVKGDYNGIGKFVEKIENLNVAACVRQVVMRGLDKGQIEANIEFVIIE